jgi:cation:H+ antiporter
MAVGDILGSNIVDVFFILGVYALVSPLVVDWQLNRLDAPGVCITEKASIHLNCRIMIQ